VIAPTVDDIRTWSKVDFAGIDYAVDSPDPLQILVDRAADYVADVTGRPLGSMPVEYVTTANEAIQLRVEQLAFKSQEDQVETVSDFDVIQSFGAGSYNESRRDMKEVAEAKLINPNPHLHDLLWRMTTADKKDEWWERWGMTPPAFEVTEVDWTGAQGVVEN
jgi:hypothetical protein